MAEKVLERVRDQLSCLICLETLKDPKLLRCHHSYCQQCLVSLFRRSQHGGLNIICPSCRQITPLPAEGVASLPSDFRANHLLELVAVEANVPYRAESVVGPSNCYVTQPGIGIVGKKSVVHLRTTLCDTQLFQETKQHIECELVSISKGAIIKVKVEWLEESGCFSLSYCPVVKGKHGLHVRINGKPLVGSPFSVAVKVPVMKFSSPIRTIHNVSKPCGIALNPHGDIVVTEEGKDCVSVFNPNTGKKLLSFGEHGFKQGQFKFPSDVAIDNDGNILVVDQNNHRIQKFSAGGQFVAEIGSKGCGPLRFKYPRGIAINSSTGKIYVVDWNDSIQILNPDLTFYWSFGEEGSDQLNFRSPRGIACCGAWDVYVADSDNYRVQRLTREGKFVSMFGMRGYDRGKFQWLSAIAADEEVVYVSEGTNDRVSIFTPEGQFVTSFGDDNESSLNCPLGLAVDESGNLYVCDSKNNCIKVF